MTLRLVGAEAQHLAEPLVEVAVGAVAARRVLDDPHRHRRADDAGHRPDRAMMVAGLERDAPRVRRVACAAAIVSAQPSSSDGAEDRAAHRPAHRRPRDRRPGMQDQPAPGGHRGHDVARDRDVDQHRIGFEKTRERDLIRALDRSHH